MIKGLLIPRLIGFRRKLYKDIFRGLNKEELELYTEMKARRDAEDEAKRAMESSDEEVSRITRSQLQFVAVQISFVYCSPDFEDIAN